MTQHEKPPTFNNLQINKQEKSPGRGRALHFLNKLLQSTLHSGKCIHRFTRLAASIYAQKIK